MCTIGAVVKVIYVPADKPIKGYRAWIRSREYRAWIQFEELRSLYSPSLWSKTETNTASNVRKNNQSGFWAFNTKKLLESTLGNIFDHEVHGSIFGWGKVALHEKGFRCQYAKILRLDSK